ncbi:thiamine phosphate synthase [Gluconacetobacter azotocaptans]|uniref:Thiamine-phosphate synthase n=1 Tax=Gluconacetobacter azotocaptans TaxID=142834 RepID=A0A7W4PG82_9PROT|nr:thiamine phosphate synthase [Gluconacetobacter azotocaptans]MBB2191339.1 thiamine phosphate synthase [Gluconacetobacter azotocaptans]MBM9402483.1 thiamine phosphate synthase [Gluconacetobacter azotocaptans]GBQ33570.1 thiamine phosphate pyrophosphorylase [Gluconacetobacter azotocaptans DSM 13594]
MTDCQLYLVTPPAFDPAALAPELARALDAGPVAAVQLRLKDASDDAILRAIDILRPVAQERDIAFILNDRPDLARRGGCDGAHVGMDDMGAAQARALLGDDLQLGVSCYDSRDMAMRAGEAGADYVAFGAFFPSSSKDTDVRADIDLLAWWTTMMELPVVAIGGITADNCAPLVRAGADFLAVISAVWSHPDGPAAGVRAMNAAIAAA